MVKNVTRIYLFALLLMSNSTFAGLYAGAVYTFTAVDPDVATADQFSPTILIAKGGYEFFDYFGLELRAGTGITDGTRVSGGVEETLGFDSMYGGYLKLQTGGRDFNPYFMAGYTNVKLTVEGGGYTGNVDDGATSYGLGVDGVISDTIYFTLELMRYYNVDRVTVDGVGAGITARF
jgi:hypothetical protein